MPAELRRRPALPAVLGPLSVSLAGLAIAAREPDAVAIAFRRKVVFRAGCAAGPASLPPAAVLAEPVPLVGALVSPGEQGLEVRQLVVGPVAVAVVDLMAWRDLTKSALPDPPVLGDQRAVIQLEVDVSVLREPAVFDAVCHAREIAPGRLRRYSRLTNSSKSASIIVQATREHKNAGARKRVRMRLGRGISVRFSLLRRLQA